MGLATIGAKIVIEGESDYRKSIKSITSDNKELESQMKLLSATYEGNQNSVAALTQKHELLTKQLEVQNRKAEETEKVLANTTLAQEKSEKKVLSLSEALEKAKKEMDLMKQSTETSEEALSSQKKVIDGLAQELLSAEKEYTSLTEKEKGFRTSLNYTQTEIVKMNGQIQKNEQYIKEAESSTDGLASSVDQYGKEVKTAGDKSEEFGTKSKEAINSLAEVLVAAGIARSVEEIVSVLTECVEKSREFETAVVKISTVANNSKVSMSDISTEILQVATAMGVSSIEISDAVYNAISAAVDTADAVSFAGQATKLAIGGFTDATTSVDILTTTLNAYQLAASETEHISDMLVTTQNLGKTTVNELASSMGKVIPIASAYNVEMDNLSSAYAVLTINGIATSESTTYLKGMLNELGDSGSEVSGILVEKTGKSFATLMKDGSSLGDVLQIIGASVQNNKAEFNGLWSSSEAGVGALSLLTSGADGFNEVLEKMNTSAGATEEAFQKMANRGEQADNRMVAASENLQTVIGNKLAPALDELNETGAEAFTWAADFIDENPEVVIAITTLTVALGVFTVGVTAAKIATLALNTAMAMNPAVLITAAIIGLASAFATLEIATQNSTTELKKFTRESKEETKIITESVNAIKEKNEHAKNEIVTIEKLIDRVSELNEKESLSNTEKTEMAKLVDQLNDAMPDLNISINEQTGFLNETTKAFHLATEAGLDYYKLSAAQEELEESAKAAYEAEMLLNELYAKQIKLKDKMNEVTYFNDANLFFSNSEAIMKLNTTISENEMALDAANQSYATAEEYIRSHTIATEEDQLAQEASADAMEEITASIGVLTSAYNDAKISANESLKSQLGLFEELKVSSDLSMEQIASNLRSQTDTMKQYKEDMLMAQGLIAKGFDEELLGSIQELGLSGAGYLHELVNSFTDDKDGFNKVMQEWNGMEYARENLSTTMAEIETNFTTSMDNLLAMTETKNGEMTLASEVGLKTLNDTYLGNIPMLGASTHALAKSSLDSFEETLGIKNGDSSEMKTFGKTAGSSFALGILESAPEVKEAFKKVVNDATSSLDLSGFVNNINNALGEAIS